jgi:hypothetical protein
MPYSKEQHLMLLASLQNTETDAEKQIKLDNILINACANAAEARTAQWQSKLEDCKTEEERVEIQRIVQKEEVADLRRDHRGGANTQVSHWLLTFVFALGFVYIQV